ncbi:MAG: DUF4153 domain-containing protein [Patescibacteria group bacterium]
MKRLSFHDFLGTLRSVVGRFPFPLLLSLVGTVLAIVLIHVDDPNPWSNMLMVLSLATPVSVVIVLFAEGMGWGNRRVWIFNAVLTLMMVGYFFILPESAELVVSVFLRHVMWTFAFVLGVTFIAFVRQYGEMAVGRFWEFCRRLVVATILTGIWAFALQMGLMAALSSTDFLFSLSIPDERYAELMALIAGVFCTTFFLSRVPRKPSELSADLAYPKEVRLFTTFVLVPLVSIYFIILYLYTGKILLTGEWPEGQLAYIILGFSVVGLLTYLALYPLRKEVAWVRAAGTALCVAIIPQALMLMWSLWFRVSEYGLTENRYLVYVYGVWLLGVSIYLLASRLKDIRVIPLSLFVLAILCSVGSWGAFSVSVHSQAGRLEDILERNDRFVDGKYVASDNEVSDEDLYEMSQVLNYLVEEREVYWVIEPWFEEELDFSDVNRWSQAEFVMEDGFGLEYRFYVPSRGEPDPRESFNFSLSDLNVAIPIDNHEFVFEYYNHLITPISVGEKTLRLAVNQAEERIDLTLDDDPLGYIPLKELIDRGMKSSQFRPMHLEDATVVVQTEKFNAKVVVKSLQGYKEDDRVLIDYIFTTIFLTLK